MHMEPISRGTSQQQAVSNIQTVQTSKVPERGSASRAEESGKTESSDRAMDVEIAKESDESVTLSIQADRKLIDEQKDVELDKLDKTDLDKLKKAMEQAIAALPHSSAKFGVHEKTNRIIIKLVDRDTQEVIKEFPPEKTLDLLAKRLEFAGVLVDQRM